MGNFDWAAFIKEVHDVAVQRGDWDDIFDIEWLALLHSDWSRALLEYYSDGELYWHPCMFAAEQRCYDGPCPLDVAPSRASHCIERDKRMCGHVVPLVDGALRVLSAIGQWELDVMDDVDLLYDVNVITRWDLPELVAELHYDTANLHSIGMHAWVDKIREKCTVAMYCWRIIKTIDVWMSEATWLSDEYTLIDLMQEKLAYDKARLNVGADRGPAPCVR